MSERRVQISSKMAGAAALTLVLVAGAQGQAMAGNNNEVFNAVPQNMGAVSAPRAFTPTPANPVAAPGAMDMAGAGKTPETRWFEALDSIVFKGYPTDMERNILGQNFNQEAERVQRWIVAAQSVSHRYHQTAQALRNLPVPANWSEMADYRDARANWFEDAANIQEDLYRPRKPARTIEELTAQLNEVDSRAKVLANTKQSNRDWDRKLRRKYRVHAPKETDALTGYVTGQTGDGHH